MAIGAMPELCGWWRSESRTGIELPNGSRLFSVNENKMKFLFFLNTSCVTCLIIACWSINTVHWCKMDVPPLKAKTPTKAKRAPTEPK